MKESLIIIGGVIALVCMGWAVLNYANTCACKRVVINGEYVSRSGNPYIADIYIIPVETKNGYVGYTFKGLSGTSLSGKDCLGFLFFHSQVEASR